MTLFSSTIALAERWTDEASSTLQMTANAFTCRLKLLLKQAELLGSGFVVGVFG